PSRPPSSPTRTAASSSSPATPPPGPASRRSKPPKHSTPFPRWSPRPSPRRSASAITSPMVRPPTTAATRDDAPLRRLVALVASQHEEHVAHYFPPERRVQSLAQVVLQKLQLEHPLRAVHRDQQDAALQAPRARVRRERRPHDGI